MPLTIHTQPTDPSFTLATVIEHDANRLRKRGVPSDLITCKIESTKLLAARSMLERCFEPAKGDLRHRIFDAWKAVHQLTLRLEERINQMERDALATSVTATTSVERFL